MTPQIKPADGVTPSISTSPEIESAPAGAEPLRFDENGRLIPRTPEQHAAAKERLSEALERMAEILDDDPPGTDEAFMRGIDANRGEFPLFEGYY